MSFSKWQKLMAARMGTDKAEAAVRCRASTRAAALEGGLSVEGGSLVVGEPIMEEKLGVGGPGAILG